MTKNKILAVTAELANIINEKSFFLDDALPNANAKHLLYMIDQIPKFIYEDRIEKVNRWLGYIQGVLVARGAVTLEQMKQLNMLQ